MTTIDPMCSAIHEPGRRCGICIFFSHIRTHERDSLFELSQSDHSCQVTDCDTCQRLIGILDLRERLMEGVFSYDSEDTDV